MKLRYVLFVLLILLTGWASAQTPEFAWSKNGKGILRDYTYSVNVDFNGYVYITGETFSANLTFGSLSLTFLSGTGNCDFILGKFDPQGNPVWVKQGGGTLTDRGYGVVTDLSGNVFVTGHYFGTATFGTYTISSSGNLDAMTMKYDSSGTIQWLKEGKSISQVSTRGIARDPQGNIIITGYYGSSTVDSVRFDSVKITTNGQRDIFIVKYDGSGAVQWGRTAGSIKSSEQGNDVATDAAGNIYATGVYYDTASFSGTTLYGALGEAFAAKYTAAGQLVWAKGMGGAKSDDASGIAVDASGNVYVAGRFDSAATFGAQNIIGKGKLDAFLAKFDNNGNFQWVRAIGDTGNDYLYDVEVDQAGNILAVGSYQYLCNFNGTVVTSNGLDDAFAVKFDASGNMIWYKTAGGNDADKLVSMKLDGGNNIIATGSYKGWYKAGVDSFMTMGVEDIVFTKLGNNPVPVELTSFHALQYDGEVRLEWTTATELNNSGFDIEKSADGVNFEKIGFVAGHGSTTQKSVYSFSDKQVRGGTTYYRLRQIDYSGVNFFSHIVEVVIENNFSYALYDNYPNPFNPATRISFSLAEKSAVTLNLYNSLGEFVTTIISGQKDAGVYSIDFNATGLSSGIYFYELRAGDFRSAKKMILSK